MNLAIVIPTMNGVDHLARALNFYENNNFKGTLYITDSTDNTKDAVAIKLLINNSKIKIEYLYHPKTDSSVDEIECIRRIIPLIKEDYVTFAGDDDFSLFKGWDKAIKFLDCNMDYSICSGIRLNFIVNNEGQYNVSGISIGEDFDNELPSYRFKIYMISGSSLMYFLFRKELFIKMLDFLKIKVNFITNEWLPCSIAVLNSKVKSFNEPTAMQESNRFTGVYAIPIESSIKNENKLTPFFIEMFKSKWKQGVDLFEHYVVSSLIKNEDITKEQAVKIFNTYFMYRCTIMCHYQLTKKIEGTEDYSIINDYFKVKPQMNEQYKKNFATIINDTTNKYVF